MKSKVIKMKHRADFKNTNIEIIYRLVISEQSQLGVVNSFNFQFLQ